MAGMGLKTADQVRQALFDQSPSGGFNIKLEKRQTDLIGRI